MTPETAAAPIRITDAAWQAIEGAYDLQVHVAPDVISRRIDDLDLAKEFLARKGFDPQMGARPMARLIQDTIRKALADELLFGRLVSGGKVTIDVGDNGQIKLVFEEAKEAEPVA